MPASFPDGVQHCKNCSKVFCLPCVAEYHHLLDENLATATGPRRPKLCVTCALKLISTGDADVNVTAALLAAAPSAKAPSTAAAAGPVPTAAAYPAVHAAGAAPAPAGTATVRYKSSAVVTDAAAFPHKARAIASRFAAGGPTSDAAIAAALGMQVAGSSGSRGHRGGYPATSRDYGSDSEGGSERMTV